MQGIPCIVMARQRAYRNCSAVFGNGEKGKIEVVPMVDFNRSHNFHQYHQKQLDWSGLCWR